MVLASSAAAAAPAYELPRPLAFCSIRANAEACACETPPAKAPATASETAVFLIPVRAMRNFLLALLGAERAAILAADTIAQRHSLANGPLRRRQAARLHDRPLRRGSPARTCVCRPAARPCPPASRQALCR